MTGKWMRAIVASILASAGGVGTAAGAASPAGLAALEDSVHVLEARVDSIRSVRTARLEVVIEIAARVDSLKAGAGDAVRAGGRLQEALREALAAVAAAEAAEREMHAAEAAQYAMAERARDAYDEAIGVAIEGLGDEPDAAALAELKALRAAREKLPSQSAPTVAPDPDPLVIRADDTPRDIRRKAQLLDDVADHLRLQSSEIEKEIARLEREQQLRLRANALSRDVALFDEDAAEGRTIESGNIGISVGGPDRGTAGREASADGSTGPRGIEDAIAQLRADRERLLSRLETVNARADSFRSRAERLVGAAP